VFFFVVFIFKHFYFSHLSYYIYPIYRSLFLWERIGL